MKYLELEDLNKLPEKTQINVITTLFNYDRCHVDYINGEYEAVTFCALVAHQPKDDICFVGGGEYTRDSLKLLTAYDFTRLISWEEFIRWASHGQTNTENLWKANYKLIDDAYEVYCKGMALSILNQLLDNKAREQEIAVMRAEYEKTGDWTIQKSTEDVK